MQKYMKCVHDRHKAKCFKQIEKGLLNVLLHGLLKTSAFFRKISSTLSAKIADSSTFRPRWRFDKERNYMLDSGLFFLKKFFAKRSRPDTCRSSRFLPVRLSAGLTAYFSAATFFIVALFGIQRSGVSKKP